MDSLANSYIRKWLGLPCCFSDAGLFGWNILKLLLKPISQGYKQEKVRLVLELIDSADALKRSAKVTFHIGHKWKVQAEVDHAVSTLQQREVMEAVLTPQIYYWYGLMTLIVSCRPKLGRATAVLVKSKQESSKKPWRWRKSPDWTRDASMEGQYPRATKGCGHDGKPL